MALSEFLKGKIITLLKFNYSQVQISKKLKINQSTVSRILSKYRITSNTEIKTIMNIENL